MGELLDPFFGGGVCVGVVDEIIGYSAERISRELLIDGSMVSSAYLQENQIDPETAREC